MTCFRPVDGLRKFGSAVIIVILIFSTILGYRRQQYVNDLINSYKAAAIAPAVNEKHTENPSDNVGKLSKTTLKQLQNRTLGV